MKSYCLLIVQRCAKLTHFSCAEQTLYRALSWSAIYKLYIYIYIYIFILIKIIVQFFECKISERVLLTGAISICKKGFQGFHTGVKLRCAACLSLQILRFEYLHYDIYHSFCMQTKIKVA